MGYNTYNDILTQTKSFNFEDRESDYYNVTVNFVVKRLPKYQADLLQTQQSIDKLEIPKQDVNTGYLQAATELHNKFNNHNEDDIELTMLQDQVFKKHQHDQVGETFKSIQNQDMEQEKFTDQKVKQVIRNQQKALADKEPFFGLSEAEKEANKLAEALQKHELNVENIQRQQDMKQFRAQLSKGVNTEINVSDAPSGETANI